jgi:hypothetical protein
VTQDEARLAGRAEAVAILRARADRLDQAEGSLKTVIADALRAAAREIETTE